jgi:hypothetical protein
LNNPSLLFNEDTSNAGFANLELSAAQTDIGSTGAVAWRQGTMTFTFTVTTPDVQCKAWKMPFNLFKTYGGASGKLAFNPAATVSMELWGKAKENNGYGTTYTDYLIGDLSNINVPGTANPMPIGSGYNCLDMKLVTPSTANLGRTFVSFTVRIEIKGSAIGTVFGSILSQPGSQTEWLRLELGMFGVIVNG